jgi:hypothetical protein
MANELTLINEIDVSGLQNTLQRIKLFQATVKKLLSDGVDYGKIEGCGDKPTLLKPGADKIVSALGLSPTYDIVKMEENYEGNGFFAYTIRCKLERNGIKIAEGLGQANSKEKKWATEYVYEKDLPAGTDKSLLKSKKGEGKYGTFYKYEIEANACSKANTILKMAEKRAKVGAALAVANLSEVFTQDFDDLPPEEVPTTEHIVNKAKTVAENSKSYNCELCGAGISEKIQKYSFEKYGKALCMNCQKNNQ